MEPKEAVNKLRRAGIGHIDVAWALVMSDPQVIPNLCLGNLDRLQIEAKVAEVAAMIFPLYSYRNRPTKSR